MDFGIWKSRTFPSLEQSLACVVRIDKHGIVQDQSPTANKLISVYEQHPDSFRALLSKAHIERTPVEKRITATDFASFWVVAVATDNGFYLTALDTTLSDRMTDALIKSRAMLKSLLDSAADISFEIDTDGRLLFLSAKDELGLNTEEWIGRYANDLFWPNGHGPARNPLTTKAATVHPKVLVHGFKAKRWFSFTTEPAFDSSGFQTGIRGTCRDVTLQVSAENQTRQDKLRLGLSKRIIQQLNTSDTPENILKNASAELVDVLRADTVWSLMKSQQGFGVVSAGAAAALPFCQNTAWQQLMVSSDTVQTISEGGRIYLTVLLEQNTRKMGMIIVGRDTNMVPWAEHEKSLLEDVTGALASAFGKAELINKLTELSTRDELTGLLNRRAFVEGVEMRLREQCRSSRSGCVLFIDLDNFKAVNDIYGHVVGDKALKLFADKLRLLVRETDYAGRLGGDEFVLWLEDISVEQAKEKATTLLDAMQSVRRDIGAIDAGLGVSIGICASTPAHDLKFEDISERADKALYEVKRTGRNNIAIAPTRAPQPQEQRTGQNKVAS